MTTTPLANPNVEDKVGLALRLTQLQSPTGAAVNVADIVSALGGTSGDASYANLTLSGNLILSNGTLVATGTNLATAAQITKTITTVTAADDTVGVKLPAAPTAGTVIIIKSTVSNKILKVYPDAAATINAIGSNAAISFASGAIPAIFVATSATQWYTIPLLPS